MIAASALVAVSLVSLNAGNRVLLENLTASDSGTRFRAAYALAHTHDPSSSIESAAVKQLLLSGLPGEQAGAGDGLLHRHWTEGHVPDSMADWLYPPVIRRSPAGRNFELRGVGVMPPAQDGLRRLSTDKARAAWFRQAGSDEENYQLWLHRADKKLQRAHAESTGDFDRARSRMVSKPGSRPPCMRECTMELMWLSWLGMDMAPILEIRKPPTNEMDWWTATLFALVKAAGGDDGAVRGLVADFSRIVDVDSRSALFAGLVRMPPGVELHKDVRALVPAAAKDPDPQLRRYAIELLAARPELYGIPGSEDAFAAALSDRDPDVRVRAACSLWELPSRSPGTLDKMKAALAEEPDPIVRFVIETTLAK